MATVITYRQDLVAPDLKGQVIDILEREWPTYYTRAEYLDKPLHDPNRHPLMALLMEDKVVVAYLGIPSTVIVLAGETYQASGLSAVITDTTQHEKGYGHQLVTAAKTLIAAGDADIGVFTCDPPLVPFYVGAGWTLMERTAVIGGTQEKPFPADSLGKCTLMVLLREGPSTPSGL